MRRPAVSRVNLSTIHSRRPGSSYTPGRSPPLRTIIRCGSTVSRDGVPSAQWKPAPFRSCFPDRKSSSGRRAASPRNRRRAHTDALRRRSCAAVSRTRSGSNNPARHWPRSPASGDVPSRWHRLRRRVRAHGPGGTKEQYMKTVIVGGVAAGASTGARLRRLDESAEIVVLERDHYVSFANCGLPYHIGGEIPERESLLLQTPESLAKSLALDVRTGQDVIRIDRDAKEVEVRDLQQGRTYRESYDKLVLCLGAEPVRPPIPGADDPRVDVLRNIPDMDRIIAQPRRGRHERRRRRRQLHRAGARRGLQGARAADHRRRADRAAHAVARPRDDPDPRLPRRAPTTWTFDSARPPRRFAEATDDRLVLDLSDGTSLEADVLVMAAGARPNVDLARDAGLEIGPRGGIVVDAQMRTSAPDILAAGDAVETRHLLTGEPTLSMLAGPANRRRPDRGRHDRRPRQRVPRHPGDRRGQGVRHDRGRHRDDRDGAAARQASTSARSTPTRTATRPTTPAPRRCS